MLYCPQHHPFIFHHHPRNPRFATRILSSLKNPDNQHHQHPETTTPVATHGHISRTHNSKSTSLLLHHINQQNHQLQTASRQTVELEQEISPFERTKLVEMSLVSTKRTPQFPGSVSPLQTTLNSPLQTLFDTVNDGVVAEDEETEDMIMKAIEMRREVTAEVFREFMMRKGKFGITYSTNVVTLTGGFIDHLMIKAAVLKTSPKYESSSFNVRAKVVIEDSNVVPLIRWLKHNGVSYNKIAKLICMSRGDIDSIRRFAEWLKTIHVKGDFLGTVMTKAGENILERSNEELDETVGYLESNGLRRDWMGYVMGRCPQLLSFSMEELRTRVEFFLDMGMNEKDFGTMVFDYPRVLGYFTLQEMKEKVNYLMEFGLNNEDAGRLLAFKPELMACSIEEKWKPLVKYLYYLGISRDGMKRMLIVKPMVFCFDMESNIVAKVRFFQDLGIRNEAIGNMLVKFPPLLTYSLNKKIRPVVIFLMVKAGVSERDIAKVIALGPQLLGCNIARKLEINLKYFLSLGIRQRELGAMIADFPMLLRYNVDLLRPKYRYLRRSMIRPLQDLIEFPRFFSYSLEERIIPRHKVLVENRINLKLRYMLPCADEEFERKVAELVERHRRFESGTIDSGTESNFEVADNGASGMESSIVFHEKIDSKSDH